MVVEGASDGHALTLSSRKFIGTVCYAVGQINCCECLFGHLMPLSGSDAAVNQGQFHVVKRRSSSEQIEGLKNKPYFLIAYTRQLVVVHFRNILIVKPVLALARRIETADQIHQRRLARARRPDDRNVLTPGNIKGD